MNKILIIPDIHGRTFWKGALKEYGGQVDIRKIIFLGDYLDPYPTEGIEPEDAEVGFRELIGEARNGKYKNKMVLLLGNHDLHYIYGEDWSGVGSRYSHWSARKYGRLFHDNIDLFNVAYLLPPNQWAPGCEVTYLFTHAGVSSGWLMQNSIDKDTLTPEILENYLNDYMDRDIASQLGQIGASRYGDFNDGSPVWADITGDHNTTEWFGFLGWSNFEQIVGHTQSEYHVQHGKHISCLDSRRAFILTESGVLGEIVI